MAIEFAGGGSDEHIDLGNHTVHDFGTGDFSIMGWIKTTTSSKGTIIGKGQEGGGENYGLYINIGGSVKVALFMFDGSSYEFVQTLDGSALDGKWHHIAGVRNGTTIYLYIDGVEIDSDTIGAGYDLDTSIKPALIGAMSFSSGILFDLDGEIDDCRIYNRGLSAAEIQTIYAARGADGIVDGLVGEWRLNEQSPGTVASGAGSVKDQSNEGNHGTPTNGTPEYRESELHFRRRAA